MPPAIMLSCINFFCLAGFTAFCNASCVQACMERAVEVFKARSGWSEAALRPQSTPAEKTSRRTMSRNLPAKHCIGIALTGALTSGSVFIALTGD